jgi:DNA transformation protein
MDNSAIEDMFDSLGPVTVKNMFGGKGVYSHGLIVGCWIDGEMVLKADAVSAPLFEAAGSKQWAYDHKNGRQVKMPYWSIPDVALDDADEMGKWAKIAFEAAVRAKK